MEIISANIEVPNWLIHAFLLVALFRSKKKDSYDVTGDDDDAEANRGMIGERHAKPPIPPKPRWTPGQSHASVSLNDSARGRSRHSSSASEASTDFHRAKAQFEVHEVSEVAPVDVHTQKQNHTFMDI